MDEALYVELILKPAGHAELMKKAAGQWPIDWHQAAWSQAAQSDALSRPSMPMAGCVWPVQAAPACQPVLAPPSGPPAGGVPSRVREPGGSTKPLLLPQPENSQDTVREAERYSWAQLGWDASDDGAISRLAGPGASKEIEEFYQIALERVRKMVAEGECLRIGMSGGGGQTGGGPRVVPTPDPVPYAGDVAVEVSDRDRKLWAAIGRGGRRSGPGVVWEGDRR